MVSQGRLLAAQAPQPADLLLVNGTVLTMNAGDAVAQAVAVRHDSIVAVGSPADIMAFKGPTTRVIDLHGRTATPGLIDTHGHFADGGVAKLFQLDLGDASSVAEVVRRVGARAATLKPGEWVLGQGWDEGKLTERRYVYARDLDAVSPKNPVWLVQTTGHYGVANGEALRLAGITRATPNPVAGTIDRDAQAAPTGVLKSRPRIWSASSCRHRLSSRPNRRFWPRSTSCIARE